MAKATFCQKRLERVLAIRYEMQPAATPRQIRTRAAPARKAPAQVESEELEVITARQIRAGRGLLNWSQAQLADAASVSRATLMRIEAGADDTKASSLRAIADALKAAGVRLYDDSDGIGEGARMAKPEG